METRLFCLTRPREVDAIMKGLCECRRATSRRQTKRRTRQPQAASQQKNVMTVRISVLLYRYTDTSIGVHARVRAHSFSAPRRSASNAMQFGAVDAAFANPWAGRSRGAHARIFHPGTNRWSAFPAERGQAQANAALAMAIRKRLLPEWRVAVGEDGRLRTIGSRPFERRARKRVAGPAKRANHRPADRG
jgi:hypothetical protein